MSQGYRNGNYVTFASDRSTADMVGRAGNGAAPIETMEQVRDLLFGQLRREIEIRLAGLERRVETMELQLKTLGETSARDRQASFEQLSRGVAELAEDIRRLSRT